MSTSPPPVTPPRDLLLRRGRRVGGGYCSRAGELSRAGVDPSARREGGKGDGVGRGGGGDRVRRRQGSTADVEAGSVVPETRRGREAGGLDMGLGIGRLCIDQIHQLRAG
jgi:hypothetical protein